MDIFKGFLIINKNNKTRVHLLNLIRYTAYWLQDAGWGEPKRLKVHTLYSPSPSPPPKNVALILEAVIQTDYYPKDILFFQDRFFFPFNFTFFLPDEQSFSHMEKIK